MPTAHELVTKAARAANLGDLRWHYRPVVASLILAGVTVIVQGVTMTMVSWYVGAALVLVGAVIASTSLLIRRNAMPLLYCGGIVVSSLTGRLRMVAPWHQISQVDASDRISPPQPSRARST